ncbi:MAG: type II secretion system F family protein [Candidatus Paceibacterota bacterium]
MVKKQKQKEKKKWNIPFQNVGIRKERDFFIENLALLMESGMSIIPALESITTGIRTKRMKTILNELQENINSGYTLWRALEIPRIFPDYIISLIRVGEETGRLSENLKIVGLQEQKNRIFRSKIRSAMMYPIFVLTVTLVVGIGIAWFILPRLVTVFSQLGLELPTATRLLIAVGEFLGEHGAIVVPIFLLIVVIVIYFVFIFKKTKFVGQWLLFNFPGIKKLIQEVELSRFGYILGTLLEVGLPITNALDSLHQASSAPGYKKMYAYLRDSVSDGNSFKKSFTFYPKAKSFIPFTIQQMISAGEQSGNLSKTLTKIGKIFETKTEITTKNLSIILEPILLVIVWLGVVGVALAVILPIYNLIGGFNY